jgi:hypothetical protein
LVEAALEFLSPMQRHGDDHIELLLARQSAAKKGPTPRRQRHDATVLKNMDQAAKRAVVFAVCVNGVEAGESVAAKRASPICIEGSRIQKRSAAIGTKVLGQERLRRTQTVRANRDSGKIYERLFANSTLVREDEVEQRRGERP